MLSWIFGIVCILGGIVFIPLAYLALAASDERGNSVSIPMLLGTLAFGLLPIMLGVAIIYWR